MNKKNKEQKIVENGLGNAFGLDNITAINNPLIMLVNSPQNLITLQPQILSNAYKTYGVLQRIIDQPVMDGFSGKGWFSSSTLESEELGHLMDVMEKEGDFEVCRDALRWERLYGGGVIIANTAQSSNKTLEKNLYNRPLKFISSDRWECVPDESEGAFSKKFVYHDIVVDSSRIYTLTGKQAPYYIRLRLQGWGLSIYEQMLSDITRFLKAQNVALELLDEAKIDILKIFNLASALSTKEGERAIRKRVDIASSQKNYKSVLAMDSNDDYVQKQVNLNGLAPLQQEIRTMICASVGIPEQKLYGIGSGGFSDDEGIIEIYNKMIEADIRTPIKKAILWVAQLRCLQLFGKEVEDLDYTFDNLRELSQEKEVEIKTKKGNFILELFKNKLLTPQEVMQALEKEDVFVMKTKALNGDFDIESEAIYGDLLKGE